MQTIGHGDYKPSDALFTTLTQFFYVVIWNRKGFHNFLKKLPIPAFILSAHAKIISMWNPTSLIWKLIISAVQLKQPWGSSVVDFRHTETYKHVNKYAKSQTYTHTNIGNSRKFNTIDYNLNRHRLFLCWNFKILIPCYPVHVLQT